MRKLRTLELAKVGKWGQDGAEISKQDIAEVVETFQGKRPITIGHGETGEDTAPKFGDVLDVRTNSNGNVLIGDTLFLPEAEGLYSDGHYDGWSVSIPKRGADGKRYLHHLAILGATPPKIPGLKELSSVPINYSDGDKAVNINFSGKIPEEEQVDPVEMQKRITALEAENIQLKKDLKDAMGKIPGEPTPQEKKFSDELKKLADDRAKSRAEGFLGRIKGKVPEGLMPKIGVLAKNLGGADPFDFADNDKQRNAHPLDVLEEVFAAWPLPVRPGKSGNDYSDAVGADGKPIDWNALATKA